MQRIVFLLIMLLSALAPLSAAADIDCRCRFFGAYFDLGDVVCLKTANGLRLAQCQMMMNNPQWSILQTACPTASAPPMSTRQVAADLSVPGRTSKSR